MRIAQLLPVVGMNSPTAAGRAAQLVLEGGNLAPDETAGIREALSAAVAAIPAGRPLSMIEITSAGLSVFHVEVDELGIPRATCWPGPPLDAATPGPAEIGTAGPQMLVNSAPDSQAAVTAYDRMRADHPSARAWASSGADVRGLLADVIADLPIRQSRELLVAGIDPSGGKIQLATTQLFPAGARRGDIANLTIRSECTDETGTVFALIAWAGRSPRLLSAYSARLPPGRRPVRAELCWPGEVIFTEPANLVPVRRSLQEVISGIPRTLSAVGSAHVICAIEIAGTPAQVAARLYRADKIIEAILPQAQEPGRLQIGLVAYGTHRFAGRRSDDPVIVAEWMAAPDTARRTLGNLGATEPGDSPAAQVEDMMAEVVDLLGTTPHPQRTALLIFGDRPPHPASPDGIMKPCPNRHDWRELLGRIKNRPDVTTTTIRDDLTAPRAVEWASLNNPQEIPLSLRTATADILAPRLGLIAPTLQHIPLPIADPNETSNGISSHRQA